MENEQIQGSRGTPPTSSWDSAIETVSNTVKEVMQPTVSDKDTDWSRASYALNRKAAGEAWEDIYKDADNPAQIKGYVAKYYKLENPELSDEQVAYKAGATQSNADRLNTSFLGDVQTGVATTMGNLGLGVRTLTGNADESDDIIRGRIKGFEDDKDYMQAYTATYDEDGSRNVDIQQGEFIGKMIPSALAGGTVGAVAKTKAGALAADMALTSAETTIDAAATQTLDWSRYPKQLATNLAATLAGGLLFPSGPSVTNSYNKEQLEELAGGMKILGDLDVPISAEMLKDPAIMKKNIDAAYKDPWKRKEAMEAVENLNADVVNEIKRISHSVGATPKQMVDFRAGRISSREIGGKFRDMAESHSIGKQGEVNVIRERMKFMDFDESGKPRQYQLGEITPEGEYTGFLRDLIQTAGDNDTVMNYIERQVKFRGQLSGDDSLEAATIINKHTELLASNQSTGRALSMSTADLGLRQNKLKKLLDDRDAFTKEYSSLPKDKRQSTSSYKQEMALYGSKIDKQKVLINDSRGIIKASTLTLESNKKELGATLTGYRKLKADAGGALSDDYSAATLVKDPTKFTAQDMESLLKSINEKINVGGGAISTADKTQVGILRRMKTKLLAKMDETIQDPAFLEARTASNKLTREKYNLITDQGGIKGLKNAMNSSDPKDFTRLFTSDEHGVSNLKHFKELNGGEYPKEYNEMLNKVYSGKVLDGVEDVGGYNLGLNFDKLQKNLNKEDLISDLMPLAPPEVVESFKNLKGLVNAYGGVFKEISENRAQLMGPDQGWAAKLGELMELIGSPLKGLKASTEVQIKPVYDTIQKLKGSPKRLFWYDEKANFSEAIEDTLGRLNQVKSPEKKKAMLDQTITEFISSVAGKLGKKGGKMRGAHLTPFKPADEFAINPVAADAGMRVKRDSVTKAMYKMGVTDIDPKINNVATKANTPIAADLYQFKKSNKISKPAWEGDDKIKDAIENYTGESELAAPGEGFNAISKASRGGETGADLHKLWTYPPNFDGAVYRGTRLKSAQVKAYDGLKEGDILSNSAPLSTSKESKITADFLPNQTSVEVNRLDSIMSGLGSDRESLVVTIRSKNGYDISKQSVLSGEQEVLIKPNTALRVVRKDVTGNIKHLLLEEVEVPTGAKMNKHILQALGLVGAGSAYENGKERQWD